MLAALLVLLLFAVTGAARAQNEDANEAGPEPTAAARQRFSSDKKDASKERAEEPGQRNIVGPHGPAMDGVRGSAIGPAPGAFGTDAGRPSDLHR